MSIHEQKPGEVLETKERHEVQVPSLYKVFLVNDDYTTMDFVVHVLEAVFHKLPNEATQIMLHVHKKGVGLCGVYTKDIAETKAATVHDLAQKNGYPLQCIVERG